MRRLAPNIPNDLLPLEEGWPAEFDFARTPTVHMVGLPSCAGVRVGGRLLGT